MSAADAYRAFAPIYDAFNPQNDYEGWFSVLLPELEKHGLPERGRLLDVGCGTGMAFEPMLRRGWEVYGADVSAEMLAKAREKFPDRGHPRLVPLIQADIRELPVVDSAGFDLVWALNDIVNYLLDDGDLECALAGLKANLAPGGLVAFDANTLHLFELNFTAKGDGEIHERGWVWEGLADEIVSGGTFEARLSGEGVETHIHRERHYPRDEIVEAMAEVGLDPVAVLGQGEEEGRVNLAENSDELVDLKIIYVGRSE